MKREQQIELFFLISLLDIREPTNQEAIFNNIRDRRYMNWAPDIFDHPCIVTDLLSTRFIKLDENKKIQITDSGRRYLRLLCGQASGSDAKDTGHARINHYRNRYDMKQERSEQARDFQRTKLERDPERPDPNIERKLEEAGEIYPYNILAKALLNRLKTEGHNVYVVKLKNEIRTQRKPRHDGKENIPCVYVGLTGLSPEERFENHKNDYKASKHVRDYGVCLMPELYEHYNSLPWELAVEVEPALAKKLHRLGFTVYGGR